MCSFQLLNLIGKGHIAYHDKIRKQKCINKGFVESFSSFSKKNNKQSLESFEKVKYKFCVSINKRSIHLPAVTVN